jgi:hypothetical protein
MNADPIGKSFFLMKAKRFFLLFFCFVELLTIKFRERLSDHAEGQSCLFFDRLDWNFEFYEFPVIVFGVAIQKLV